MRSISLRKDKRAKLRTDTAGSRLIKAASLFSMFAVPVFSQTVPEGSEAPTLAPAPTPTPSSTRELSYSQDYSNTVLPGPSFEPVPGQAAVGSFLRNPFQLGPFALHPHIDYRFTYGNGISHRPGQQETTIHQLITPGLTAESKHVTLDYTPGLNYYSSKAFQDHLDHNASARAEFGYSEWDFGVVQRYNKSSSPLIETAQQTSRESHTTDLTAHRPLSQKLSLDLTFNQYFQFSDSLNNSRQWSTMDWINYHLTEKLYVGGGMGGGYADVDLGSDMTFEQIQGRVGWAPGQKLSIDLNGGIEIRQFLDAQGSSDRVNPIMGAAIRYSPVDATTLSLQANRSVNTSFLANQITETSSITLNVSQRFFGKLNLRLLGGYRTSDFQASLANVAVNRTDDYYFFSANLGTRILQRGTASIFYQHSENDSSARNFGFVSDQYGFQLGYHF